MVRLTFAFSFWARELEGLGYPLSPMELDVGVLIEDRFLPRELNAARATRLYSDKAVDVVVVEVPRGGLTRVRCVKAARMWKERTLGLRPLLAFTDGEESYAVIVPGAGTGGEAKVLWMSGELYRTDREVLKSIKFPGAENFSKVYDSEFFPYERVRTEFFEGYRDLYGRVLEAVKPIIGGEAQGYAQRWLGRLMFLYFLQRKGWLAGDRRYISKVTGYRELNKLYYEALYEGTQTPDIPYLNSTLFEREKWITPSVEDRLDPMMGPLLEDVRRFFGGYNFTVDESSPLEVDVSIDPTLIGTVFENMLPEHERGGKGVFYTQPREISFICRRALTEWLNSPDRIEEEPGGKLVFRDGIDRLVERMGAERKDREIRDIISRLKEARVVDPAVGSGGFLLGMMQEIVALIKRLEVLVGEDTPTENLKLDVLKNLYGFDIEPEAIEIAMLRLWLSLVIDRAHPRPLPNINRNLVVIKDSLQQGEKKQQKWKGDYTAADPRLAQHNALHWLYLNEYDGAKKKKYLEQLQALNEQFHRETGVDWDIIEFYMYGLADIVVMNPPYVRQESIPEAKKAYYVSTYGLDKKSDLFAYFMMRAHNLLAPGGVASVITSDKWLETGYGVSLQKAIRPYLVAVYGQKERSFGADINTVISVYSRARMMDPVSFTYIERYGEPEVRRSTKLERRKLEPGKWFYLRAPKVYMEKILPKLTYKLGDFAEIKFGIKTGANDFFYMKDVTHLYEADRLANPDRFKDVPALTSEQLKGEGLIYIENNTGNRFVIEKKDVSPLVKSPTELDSYVIKNATNLILNPKPPEKPGKYTIKYIKWGEHQDVVIQKGKEKGRVIKGYNNLKTTENRKPNWFNIPDLKPANIIPNRFIMERHFNSYSEEPILAGDACALLYPKNKIKATVLWIWMNSTLFYLIEELHGMRMGAAALQLLAGEFEGLPCIDINKIEDEKHRIFNRLVEKIEDEIKLTDRINLDKYILNIIGLNEPEYLHQLYNSMIEVFRDRVIKAGIDKVSIIIEDEKY